MSARLGNYENFVERRYWSLDDNDEVFVLGPLHYEMMEDLNYLDIGDLLHIYSFEMVCKLITQNSDMLTMKRMS